MLATVKCQIKAGLQVTVTPGLWSWKSLEKPNNDDLMPFEPLCKMQSFYYFNFL